MGKVRTESKDQGTHNIWFTKLNRVAEASSSGVGWKIAVEINTLQAQKNQVNISLIRTEVTLTNITFKSPSHV